MLVFVNGYMTYFDDEGDAVLDENGNPGVDSGSDSGSGYDGTSVECYIETLTADKKGRYDDGRYSNAQYSVLINSENVPLSFNPLKVGLVHDRKGDLGVLEVQRIEFYELTQSIELWV